MLFEDGWSIIQLTFKMYTVYVKPVPYTEINKKTAGVTFLALHWQKGVKNHR